MRTGLRRPSSAAPRESAERATWWLAFGGAGRRPGPARRAAAPARTRSRGCRSTSHDERDCVNGLYGVLDATPLAASAREFS